MGGSPALYLLHCALVDCLSYVLCQVFLRCCCETEPSFWWGAFDLCACSLAGHIPEIYEGLFLGSRIAASNRDWLDRCSIRTIINVTAQGQAKNFFEGEDRDRFEVSCACLHFFRLFLMLALRSDSVAQVVHPIGAAPASLYFVLFFISLWLVAAFLCWTACCCVFFLAVCFFYVGLSAGVVQIAWQRLAVSGR
jgi:hypothetical protein